MVDLAALSQRLDSMIRAASSNLSETRRGRFSPPAPPERPGHRSSARGRTDGRTSWLPAGQLTPAGGQSGVCPGPAPGSGCVTARRKDHVGRCANPGGRHKMAAPVRAANRAAGGRHAGRGGARSSGRTVRLPGHGSELRFGGRGGRKEGVALHRKCVRMFTMLGTRPFRCRGNAGRGLLLPGKRARRLRPGPRPPFPPRARSLPVPPGAAPFPVPPRPAPGLCRRRSMRCPFGGSQ